MIRISMFLILMVLSLPGHSSVSNSNYNYSITIENDGNFTIVIKTKYSENRSLKSIMKSTFLSNTNMKKSDPTFISSSTSINLTNTINSKNGLYKYVQTNKNKKNNTTATIKNSCFINISDEKITNNCKITSSSASLIGSVFNYGSTKIECAGKSGMSKSCVMTTKGQPDSIDLYFVGKTEERLAVSGASTTISATFNLFYGYINGYDSLKKIKYNSFYTKNVESLWEEMMKHLKDKQYLSSTLKATSSDNGYYVRTIWIILISYLVF